MATSPQATTASRTTTTSSHNQMQCFQTGPKPVAACSCCPTFGAMSPALARKLARAKALMPRIIATTMPVLHRLLPLTGTLAQESEARVHDLQVQAKPFSSSISSAHDRLMLLLHRQAPNRHVPPETWNVSCFVEELERGNPPRNRK